MLAGFEVGLKIFLEILSLLSGKNKSASEIKVIIKLIQYFALVLKIYSCMRLNVCEEQRNNYSQYFIRSIEIEIYQISIVI
jgi:hypothetical protein